MHGSVPVKANRYLICHPNTLVQKLQADMPAATCGHATRTVPPTRFASICLEWINSTTTIQASGKASDGIA